MEIQSDSDAVPGQDSNQQSDQDFDMTDLIRPPTRKQQTYQFSESNQKNKEVQHITQQVNTIQVYAQNLPYIVNKFLFSYQLNIYTKETKPFKNFMKKSQSQIITLFDAIRANIKQKDLIKKIKDKFSHQIMVVRVVEANQKNSHQVKIQDETGEALLHIANGFFWVGMIVVIRVEWQIDNYFLKEIIQDYLPKSIQKNLSIPQNTKCHRITIAKGPFTSTESDEMSYLSLHLLIHEITKNNTNTLILMGPFVCKKNKRVRQGTCEKEYETIMKGILKELNTKLPNIKLIIIPSTSDIFHPYPLPQPKFNIDPQKSHLSQNPATLIVKDKQEKLNTTINIINTDFIGYIDKNKVGKVSHQLIQKIYEQYLKQKLILTGSNPEETFDEANFMTLYNQGRFGEIIIYGSYQKRPNIKRIGNHVFVNVGSILSDEHEKSTLGYFTEVTVYEINEQLLCDRTRVDIKKINY